MRSTLSTGITCQDTRSTLSKPRSIRQKDVFFRKYNKALRNRVAPDLEKKPFEDVYLERNEVASLSTQIETRILKRLYHSELVDIHKFNFKMDLRKDLGLDSLNITALITEIEQEFTVVFEDKVFETVTNLNDLIYKISRDPKAF